MPDLNAVTPIGQFNFTKGLYLFTTETNKYLSFKQKNPLMLDPSNDIELCPSIDAICLYNNALLTDKFAEISLVGTDERPRR